MLSGKQFWQKITFALGISLLTINIIGLLTPLRNDDIYNQKTGFQEDITLSEKEALTIINQPEEKTEDYIIKANDVVNKSLLHYWEDDKAKKYNIILPLSENWILYFLTHLFFRESALKYKFCNHKKTIQRGVGVCSQASIALADILNRKKIKTNIISWPEHTVTEVEVKPGEWWIADPDYGIIIRHSISEIEKNPSLIIPYYSAKYPANICRKLEEIFAKPERKIFTHDGPGYSNCNGIRKTVESWSYIFKWIIPLIMIGAFTPSLFKKKKYPPKLATKKKTLFIIINAMGAGGAERVVANILPGLTKKYSVHLLLLQDTLFYNLPKNVSVHFLSHSKSKVLMVFRFCAYLIKTKRLTKKYHPTKTISFLEIANFVNILTNKNAIISFRTSLSFFKKRLFGKIYIIMIKLLYPRAKKIIVNSRENKLLLVQNLQIPAEKITVIYNPLNQQEAKIQTKKVPKLPFQKKKHHQIFITIGRFDKLKNISTIINSFKGLSKKNILLIIGDGPEKESLKKLIFKNKLTKQVFLLGKKKNIYQYLNLANYFIFASRAEGFPNVLIEAMFSNLPIITSDFQSGAREIIDPNLNFTKKINYPYYGPNGALLSVDKFEADFRKINLKKLKQKQEGLERFNINTVHEKWKNI